MRSAKRFCSHASIRFRVGAFAFTSEPKNEFGHVVLIAVRISPVARLDIRREAERLECLHRMRFEIGDEHAAHVAQTVIARGVDQMIDEHGAETDAAELWVHHPLDAADETERSAFAAMER